MSGAVYCDRCDGLFAGPPQAKVVTGRSELDLCSDCVEELEDWWELPETDSSSKPIANVDRE